jgi:hypothetical protein
MFRHSHASSCVVVRQTRYASDKPGRCSNTANCETSYDACLGTAKTQSCFIHFRGANVDLRFCFLLDLAGVVLARCGSDACAKSCTPGLSNVSCRHDSRASDVVVVKRFDQSNFFVFSNETSGADATLSRPDVCAVSKPEPACEDIM